MAEKRKENTTYIKQYFIVMILYFIVMALVYVAGGKEFHIRESRYSIEEFPADNIVGDITIGRNIEQIWLNRVNYIEEIGVMLSNYNKEISGNIHLKLWREDTGDLLAEKIVLPEEIGLNQYSILKLDKTEKMESVVLRLSVTSDNGEIGLAPTALYQSQKEIEDGIFRIDGKEVSGALCIGVHGKEEIWTGSHYKSIILCGWLFFSLCYFIAAWRYYHGKKEPFFSTMAALKKYGFLMEQLVGRDFKVRYKRSMLGIFWSFLNPLLTMTVQYIVFSQLFKSDIENFQLYLLSGLVMFNFFNEAVGQSLGSIVYNAPLITKVYVPKYIYPITKVLSSAINFLISMVPLFLVIVVTREPITKAFLMIPFVMACIILFTIGVGMLLSALMVFFRDIQFLWGIISLLWLYMTPLFYPETILAPKYQWIFDYNAMHYYIKFLRKIVLDGVSPEPIMYVQCVLFSLGALLIGGVVFKKTQDKFVMNI